MEYSNLSSVISEGKEERFVLEESTVLLDSKATQFGGLTTGNYDTYDICGTLQPGDKKNCCDSNNLDDVKNSTHQEDQPEQNHQTRTSCCSKYEKIKSVLIRIPKRKILTLFLCTFATFLSTCGFALLSPFFAREALKKGMDLTTIGFVFSLYNLGAFVVSPIVGKHMSSIGTRFVYLSGIFLLGGSMVCFGALDKCPGGTPFTVLCILCRSVESIGSSAFLTAGITILSTDFPDNIGIVLAVITTIQSIGLMVGPVIGGFLYDLGGFGLPFYVIGGLTWIDALFLYFFLPEPPCVSCAHRGSLTHLLNNAAMCVPAVCIFVSAAGITTFDVTLALLMEPFNLPTSYIGLFFIIAASAFTLMSPLLGYLADSIKAKELLILVSLPVFGASFLISGPSHVLPFIPFTLWSVGVGWFLAGASVGGISIPTLSWMSKSAQELGCEDNLDTHAMVSGLYLSAYALGGFTGPFLGSMVVGYLGFPWGFTIFGFVCYVLMVVVLVYFVIGRCDWEKSG